MDERLVAMKCRACSGEEPALTDSEIEEMQPQVPAWALEEIDGVKQLRRTFTFDNFADALAFVNAVGDLAESEGHHPVIEFTWGRVTVSWYTHKISGLHQNDFIMAAKTDEVY